MLDKAALTQKVIASNIANVNTPGYRRLSVSFNSVLRKAETNIKRTDPRHFPLQNVNESIEPEIVIVEDGYWNGKKAATGTSSAKACLVQQRYAG